MGTPLPLFAVGLVLWIVLFTVGMTYSPESARPVLLIIFVVVLVGLVVATFAYHRWLVGDLVRRLRCAGKLLERARLWPYVLDGSGSCAAESDHIGLVPLPPRRAPAVEDRSPAALRALLASRESLACAWPTEVRAAFMACFPLWRHHTSAWVDNAVVGLIMAAHA